jgi:hypothetical protein
VKPVQPGTVTFDEVPAGIANDIGLDGSFIKINYGTAKPLLARC